MSKIKMFALVAISILSLSLYANPDEICNIKAIEYFEEVKVLCAQDSCKTWGIELYGPILFVDMNTREIVANVQDANGQLKKVGNVYTGIYPNSLPIANTAVEWNGTRWTMVIWQALGGRKLERNNLIIHELWHRIQEDIGFKFTPSNNSHLNELDGRLLLKMEWLALAKAIETNGNQQLHHMQSALQFRQHRRALFAGSDTTEVLFEMHEGLATHTGFRLCGASDIEMKKMLLSKVNKSVKQHTLLLSFAYTSGVLYGYLLDQSGRDWRKDLTQKDDFGRLLIEAYDLKLSNGDINLENLYSEYDTDNLMADEQEYEIEMQAFLKLCEQRFLGKSNLIIPMSMCQISFNPHDVVPFGIFGTVYKTFNAFGEWGKLETNRGALVAPDWSKVIIDAPDDDLSSLNWSISLNAGWGLIQKSDGHYYVMKL